MVEDIVIDKNKGKKQTASKTTQKSDSQVTTDLVIKHVQIPTFATFDVSLYICRFSVPEKFFI